LLVGFGVLPIREALYPHTRGGHVIVIQALDGGRRQGPDYGLVGSFFSGPAAGKLRPVELAGR
jgi:hypothetical protein